MADSNPKPSSDSQSGDRVAQVRRRAPQRLACFRVKELPAYRGAWAGRSIVRELTEKPNAPIVP